MNIECKAPHQQRISDRNIWIMHVLHELWTHVNTCWMRLIMSAPHQQGDVRLGCLNHAWFLCEARCLEGQGGRVGRGDGELWEENHFLGMGKGVAKQTLDQVHLTIKLKALISRFGLRLLYACLNIQNELQSICLPLLWQASLQTNDLTALTAPRGSHVRWWNNTLQEWWNRTKGPFFMLTSNADVHGYGWFCPNSTMMGKVMHHWRRGQGMHSMGSKSMEEVLRCLFC